MNRMARFWSETAPSARWVTYVSVPLGAAMASVGVYGDSRGWWEHRGFLTNLLSSMTSVFFGVPTALIVLSWLGTHQAEAQERRATVRRTRLVSDQLREALLRNFALTDLGALKREMTALATSNHTQTGAMRALRQQPTNENLRDEFREEHAERERVINACLVDRHGRTVSEWLGDIALSWRTLDEEMRPRLEGFGLRWLPTADYLRLQREMKYLHAYRTAFHNLERDVPVLLGETPSTDDELDRKFRRVERELEASHYITGALAALLHRLDDLQRIAT